MKKVLFLCLCAASFATAQSQVTYGVKGGLSITNIGGADLRFNLGLSKLDNDGDAKVYNRVWQAGVFYTPGSTK